MRVLRISHSQNVSAYRERERALHRTGKVEVACICPSDWQHLGSSNSKIREPFPTQQIKTYLTGNVPLFAYETAPIVKALKDFAPDIVDIHEEPYSVSGIQCLALAKWLAPQAAYVFYSAQNINKKYPPPFKWSERYVYKQAHGAYPCSIGVQEVLRQKGFNKPCPVIPLGVDPKFFAPHGPTLKTWNFAEVTPVIGFTGRLTESKGLQVVLHAVQQLKRNYDQPIKVLIAGNGEAEAKLRGIASDLQLSETIQWLGAISQEEMPAFYRSCSVVVVPSLTTPTWKEQFGRVPVEAMSCGVPVISSDSGSLPEVVADAGVIVAENDARMLASALYTVLSDKQLQQHLVTRGLELVAEKYTWDAVATSMLDLYEQAIALKQANSKELLLTR